MAIRLRRSEGSWVALCAAEFPAQEGDLYLDDGQDHAIREKLEADWRAEGLIVRKAAAGPAAAPAPPILDRRRSAARLDLHSPGRYPPSAHAAENPNESPCVGL